jgi:hypothetical protein
MKLIEIKKTKSDIDILCKLYGIENYTVNSNGFTDVDGNVNLDHLIFDSGIIPIKFGHVTGNFSCNYCNDIESLKNAPIKVDGNFRCFSTAKLKSLKGGPTYVGGTFDCTNSQRLISLEGAPDFVGDCFNCYGCEKLESLKGGPKIVRNHYNCSDCRSLTSLEGIAIDIGQNVKMIDCPKLTKLSHLKSINFELNVRDTPITNMLYVFKIKKIKSILSNHKEIDKIINNHLAGDRDIMDCQEELIDAGFGEYAKL